MVAVPLESKYDLLNLGFFDKVSNWLGGNDNKNSTKIDPNNNLNITGLLNNTGSTDNSTASETVKINIEANKKDVKIGDLKINEDKKTKILIVNNGDKKLNVGDIDVNQKSKSHEINVIKKGTGDVKFGNI